MANSEIIEAKNFIKLIERDIENFNRALDVLNDYDYQTDEENLTINILCTASGFL